ncbi:MAG: polysaccharide deacetylase family protein [Deltaproteobacteria bacterium]|nr:polysaccharide deacetylase family protein [Deltaproteobacteria bacterium]
MPELALKVDIDTYQGMRDGLPGIVNVLETFGLNASFFVSFGPDRSGLAVLQLIRPRFLMKMIRTNAPGMYGIKTALYGTLLKAPMIGTSFPHAVRDLAEKGHEVACHAWDHRLWQDWLSLMTKKSMDAWFGKMSDAYKDILGYQPAAFGAPGWRMDKRALEIAGAYGFSYLSCTRAEKAFIYEENDVIEVPSNLPCIEEQGVKGVIHALEKGIESPGPKVLPVHAEVEGTVYKQAFRDILEGALDLGYEIHTLEHIAMNLDRKSLPVRPLRLGLVPGRAFTCSV